MKTLNEEMKREKEDTEKESCSMVTAKTILLSIGFIKKKVKEDTGSRKNRIEKRNIEKKAAQGRKKRSIPKNQGLHPLTRKGRRGIRRNDTVKASVWMTRGTGVVWIRKRGHQRKSLGRGSTRYHFRCPVVCVVA